ncbi:hypothetical protein CCR75_001290 [Bremia lactucae]|uniref:Uncharacterized protein n=1 Tax=Bremia lactucae TaxID=4779 RepID=A0A976FMU9_BRELC|nr:hypothetical protein CCR75_001290 [Bremia lactucae]
MALPSGMHLVSALDDADLNVLWPLRNDEAIYASNDVRRALLLPLEGDEALDADIDVDVFRPSAMLDTQLSSAFGNSDTLLYGSIFQPELVNAEEDIEQLLLSGSEEAFASLQSHHQHQSAPGKSCECRTFAIQASHVQAQQERVATNVIATKDQKRVLRHTFGSGTRLCGFGFKQEAATDLTDQKHLSNRSTAYKHSTMSSPMVQKKPEPMNVVDNDVALATMERTFTADQVYGSPIGRSQFLPAVSSPLSSTSFVSLEGRMATPLSTTSRSTVHSEMPIPMRSLSPADEVEKMRGSSGMKTSKVNMLRGNFHLSPGRGRKCTTVLPPPYLREPSESLTKRRAHSKTFHAFAQSLSFSFANNSLTDR